MDVLVITMDENARGQTMQWDGCMRIPRVMLINTYVFILIILLNTGMRVNEYSLRQHELKTKEYP